MCSILHGGCCATHKIGRWEYLLYIHLRNGKTVRNDTMTDEQGKKYTLKEIDEINNPKKNE